MKIIKIQYLYNWYLFKNTAYISTTEALIFLFQANTQNSWPVGGNDYTLHQPVTSSAADNKNPALVTASVGEIEKWHIELVGISILYLWKNFQYFVIAAVLKINFVTDLRKEFQLTEP